MNYTSEQLRAQFDTLPEALQEAIFSIEVAHQMVDIGQKNALHVDQISLLAETTGLVMLGLLPLKDFVAEIEKQLGIERARASAIADDVNLAVFIKIRDLIQNAASAPKAVGGSNGIKAYGPEDLPSMDNKNLFEQKMGQLFRIPREEVDLDGNKKSGPDPYLEQIE
ncbi:MAG: hypothetical protein AAB453_00605 [Patescibacteria group bacterium]